jgi:ParB family chromosome partitioning protein
MKHGANVRLVPIAKIRVPKGRTRALGDITRLVESIREVGLMTPITLTPKLVLISGHHRLAAVRQLGHKTIAARILDTDKLHTRLAEIDENLVRVELSVLERSEQITARKHLYEQLHPESKVGQAPGKAGGGKVAKDPGAGSFVDDTAKKTGRGRSTIAEEARIGTLCVEARDLLRGTPVAHNKSDLLLLARQSPKVQLRIAKAIAKDGGKRVRDLCATPKPEGAPVDLGMFSEDVDDLRALGCAVEEAHRLAEQLLRGWEYEPGPDIENLVPAMREYKKFLALVVDSVRDHMTPERACSCGGQGKPCGLCGGKGWLGRLQCSGIAAKA